MSKSIFDKSVSSPPSKSYELCRTDVLKALGSEAMEHCALDFTEAAPEEEPKPKQRKTKRS